MAPQKLPHGFSNPQRLNRIKGVIFACTVLLVVLFLVWQTVTADRRCYREALSYYRNGEYSKALTSMQSLSPKFKSQFHVKRVEADCYVNIVSNLVWKEEYEAALHEISRLPSDIYDKERIEKLKDKASWSLARDKKIERDRISRIKNLYRIVEIEDVSYNTANDEAFLSPYNNRISKHGGRDVVRKSYRVVLSSSDLSKAQIKSIAEHIVSAAPPSDALVLFFYWPETGTAGAYTAAKATYAPNGRWEDAREHAPKHLVMDYGHTVAELTPLYSSNAKLKSESERKKIFWDLVSEGNRAGIDGDSEEIARIIAEKFGIPVYEVPKILGEGVGKNWPAPEEDSGY